jgi:RimJ/RimL family protein N-acetyltransferase
MELVENSPLDTGKIASLISTKDDMFLVWPIAKWPFDHQQWAEVLDPGKGNISFIIREGGKPVGHAALLNKGVPDTYTVSFLYLLPDYRSQGLGRCMVAALEGYAIRMFGAKRLRLVVRDYNPRALKCYLHSGFKETGRDGTLINMEKDRPGEIAGGQAAGAGDVLCGNTQCDVAKMKE